MTQSISSSSPSKPYISSQINGKTPEQTEKENKENSEFSAQVELAVYLHSLIAESNNKNPITAKKIHDALSSMKDKESEDFLNDVVFNTSKMKLTINNIKDNINIISQFGKVLSLYTNKENILYYRDTRLPIKFTKAVAYVTKVLGCFLYNKEGLRQGYYLPRSCLQLDSQEALYSLWNLAFIHNGKHHQVARTWDFFNTRPVIFKRYFPQKKSDIQKKNDNTPLCHQVSSGNEDLDIARAQTACAREVANLTKLAQLKLSNYCQSPPLAIINIGHSTPCVFGFTMEEYPSNLRRWSKQSTVSEKERLNMCLAVLKCFKAIGESSIVHGDIKVDNIFINDKGEPRVGDWAECIFTKETPFAFPATTPICAHMTYLDKIMQGRKKKNEKMWLSGLLNHERYSLALTLVETLTNSSAFERSDMKKGDHGRDAVTLDMKQIANRIDSLLKHRLYNDATYEAIQQMLSEDAEKVSMEEILEKWKKADVKTITSSSTLSSSSSSSSR